MTGSERLVQDVREEHAPDPRLAVFDVRAEDRGEAGIRLVGRTTEPAVLDLLAERLRRFVATVEDSVVRLPDPELGEERHALVTAAIAPLYAEPRLDSAHISQHVLGRRLEVLHRRGGWWCVRAPSDRYIGWIHHGFVGIGTGDWADAWERGEGGVPACSLGAELVDAGGARMARLPWGARVSLLEDELARLPDGREGRVRGGEVVALRDLPERFPATGRAVAATALGWMATPYLWGGITPSGADCSGFVQAVYGLHGTPLPRDSDQQAGIGEEVRVDGDFSALRRGDLLYFAETPERISHVAISLGGGRIVHSALANGGVAVNDLEGALATERTLRRIFVVARRVLSA